MKISAPLLLILLTLYQSFFSVNATEGDSVFGIYANILGTNGKPSSNVLGVGLMTNYQLKNLWFLDIEIVQSESDIDQPWKILELAKDESITSTIDAVYNSTMVMTRLGKIIHSSNKKYDWYWSLGLGINSIDVDSVTGPLIDGGSFNIKTDTETETLIGLNGGIKHHLSDKWDVNYALKINYHFADWTVTDLVSNTSSKIDNYTQYGIVIGIERRF